VEDQANTLRRLVQTGAVASHEADRRNPVIRPKIVAVTAGKGGVGTTSVAVNLAAALAGEGYRTVLVDADFSGADVTTLCGIEEECTVADVLSGRRSLHETLERGPNGLQVLAGAWALDGLGDCSAEAQERLIAQIVALGHHADFVVVDAGSGLNRVVRRFWHAADLVMMVSTPDVVSVMDTYAAIKVFVLSGGTTPVSLVINSATEVTAADDAEHRIGRACERFLGFAVSRLGWLAVDPDGLMAASARRPVVIERPDSIPSVQLVALAGRVVETMQSSDASIRDSGNAESWPSYAASA